MADDKTNNTGFGAGFMADMLRDLQKQYKIDKKPKGKGKRSKAPEESQKKLGKPEGFTAMPADHEKQDAAASGIHMMHVTDAANPRPGDMLLGIYRVESDAIKGGMGAVWRVHHIGWNVDLAMKRPRSEAFRTEAQKQNFTDECKYWMNLGLHPNIVSCYYVREIEGIPTIFSEWMENGSLESHIKDGTLYRGTQEEVQERLLDIAIQFARGLHYAHENDLIHQDVKPDNLLLTEGWTAKVSDFGLAKARTMLTFLDGTDTEPEMNENATMISPGGGRTPAYCSPEQAAAQLLTKRTDIYSWAVSVLEMYLGNKPWAHGRVLTGPLVGSACREYFDMCAERPIPKALQELLAKCMRMNPDDRPRDFAVVESELQQIYLAQTGSEYARGVPAAAPDTAENLNNHALSFLDLGMNEKAEQCWNKARGKGGGSREAKINYTAYSWRKGVLDDVEALKRLDEFYAEDPSDEYIKAKTELCIEAGYSPRAAEYVEQIRDDSMKKELLRKIDGMSPLTENLIDMGKYQFYRLSSGNLFAGCFKDYYIVDVNTGEADKEEIKDNTGKKGKHNFWNDIQWDLLPSDEEKLLYIKNGTPVLLDLFTKKTQPLLPYDDIYRYMLDRSSGFVWFASSSRAVFVYSLKDNSIVKTIELPSEKYLPEGHYPEEWYTKGERKLIDGRASQLYTHNCIAFDLYKNVMVVNVEYEYHSDMKGWRDKEEEEYYGGFTNTEYKNDYLYYDRTNLNELNGYRLDRGAYLSFGPLPETIDQTADSQTDVWHSSSSVNEYTKSKAHYKLMAPDSDQVMFQCDYLFLSNRKDSIALIAWDKPSYKSYILKLPESIQRMPWRLCHVQDSKTVQEISQRAVEIENGFMTAIELGDYNRAISLYDEYGTIPGYAFSEFEGKMEDELGRCCKRTRVKEVARCELKEDISVSYYNSFAEPTPESLEFIDRMRRTRRPWKKPIRIGREMHYPGGFELLCVMRDRDTIVVKEYPEKSLSEKFSPYAIEKKGKMGRYLLIRMSDSTLIDYIPFRFTGLKRGDKGWYDGTDVKILLGMSPDGRWLLCNQMKYDMHTLQKESPFPLTVFRSYGFIREELSGNGFLFSPDSRFVCIASPDGDRIVNMETLHEWLIPQSLHLNILDYVFSSNGRFLMGRSYRGDTSSNVGFRIRWKYETEL